MLSLRDFFHLPKVDPLIEQITHEPVGLILVAGMDPRDYQDSTHTISSGRMGIFRILVRQILERNPDLRATVVSQSRDTVRVSRRLRRQVTYKLVDSTSGYGEIISTVSQLDPGLLVVDRLGAHE